MLQQNSAAEIGQYGWTHYTGEPIDGDHEVRFIPQSIADGWEAFCSCGEWRAFESLYEIHGKDALLKALQDAHAEHVASMESA